jgi:5'-nucleotidase
MNILLTNDDGIHSAGINLAYDALSRSHNVFVIAPEAEQSACSNAITVRTQLTIKKIAENKYSVSGFPADCVIIGLSGNLIPEVDLVVSGINHGPNVGDDLFFSGTVAGARTANIFGKSSLAISINCYKRVSKYVNDASGFLLDFINEQMRQVPGSASNLREDNTGSSDKKLFFNINYPDLPHKQIKGRKYTFLGRRIYRDSFKNAELSSGELNVQMGGYIESVHTKGSDTTELEKGYISITPLVLDCTNYEYLKKNVRGS